MPCGVEKTLSTENINSTKCGATIDITANYYGGPGYAPIDVWISIGGAYQPGTTWRINTTGGAMWGINPGTGTVQIRGQNDSTINSTNIDYDTQAIPYYSR
ncbi:MAG: hypothetical protein LBD85_01700 [Oscillospiraceae bacterium]|jgi:hypothetical protein|nr:hypothetical protein [Oscillospiraceae bacterium]